MKTCPCGCNLELLGQRTKYANGQYCRNRHEVKMLLCGCVPASKVVFGHCSFCGIEIISLKAKPRLTCSQLTGSACGQRQSKRKSIKTSRRYSKELPTVCKNDQRFAHISKYCIQETGQCREYARGFSIDNLNGGCWGREHTGKCYVRPNFRVQTGGRDEVAKSHRLDFKHYHAS